MTLSQQLLKELNKDLPTEDNMDEWELKLYASQINNEYRNNNK